MSAARRTIAENLGNGVRSTGNLACALCLLALLGTLTHSVVAQQNQDIPSQKATRELDQAFSSLAPPDRPGFAVLVKKGGSVIFKKGYGVRDLRTKARIDEHTNFRLASFTKQFTAMAIMLLVHDHKLRYDQSLRDVFPEFPEYGKTVTVRNLLNHTGGLPDYEDLMDAMEKNKGPIWSAENQIRDAEVLQLLEKESQGKFVPGTKWGYSNSGYVVLGLIVAKVSGKSLPAFLHERIFTPLKMDHTLVFEKGENRVADRAYGHSKKENNFVETDHSATSATQGDGGIYSNLEDLSKWDDALRNHALLSEREFLPAITPAKLPPGAESELAQDVPDSLRGHANAYGFGWFLNLQDAHPLLWHYGDTMGFKTAIFRYTDDDLSVIVLCNRSDVDPGALALAAAQKFLAGNKSAAHCSRIEVPVRYCDRKESAILTDILKSSHSRRDSGQCLLLAADFSPRQARQGPRGFWLFPSRKSGHLA